MKRYIPEHCEATACIERQYSQMGDAVENKTSFAACPVIAAIATEQVVKFIPIHHDRVVLVSASECDSLGQMKKTVSWVLNGERLAEATERVDAVLHPIDNEKEEAA